MNLMERAMTVNKWPAKALSLFIAGIDTPFALIGLENNFGPDDWAWQFLRLNHGYQSDYANALAAHDPDDDHPLGAHFLGGKHPERKIRFSESSCRMKYGLSTWLDPQQLCLPRLKRGESWFYPLSRTHDSPEDPLLQVIHEDIFAYVKVPNLRRFDRNRAEHAANRVTANSRPYVWFAIDCSVPPAAQLKSVEVALRMYRDYFHDMNAVKDSRYGNDAGFVPLKDCLWFPEGTNDDASAVADGIEQSSAWFAIRVDALGPIKEQVNAHLINLNDTYIDLIDKNFVVEPVRKRFRKELKGPRDEFGEQLSDGNFLKALVVCAQLAQHGLDEFETVQFITENAAKSGKELTKSGSTRDNWNTDFAKRAENYREDARAFVKGGYRWLVHAQKP